MFFFLFTLFLISTVCTQQCEPEKSLGPSIGTCPTGASPTSDPDGETVCCPDEFIIAPTLPTTMAPSTSIATDSAGETTVVTQAPSVTTTGATSGSGNTGTTCVDKKNPRSGVSDCPNLAYLCNDSSYIKIMTEQCPKTCGRCDASAGSTGSTGTCVDLKNPRTGVSDCPSLAYLCNDANYYSIMTTQCPRTCGRCGSSGGIATTTLRSGTCVDKVNLSTGVSECLARRSLCNNSIYISLMRDQCPRTCGFC